MKTVGEALKAAREKREISIETVSEALKIRVKYLKALEDDEYAVFNSPVYIKGFLKNYAKYLGLDEAQMLALYRRGYPVENTKLTLTRIPEKKQPVKSIRFSLKPEYLVALVTVFVILAILFYLLFEYRSFLSPPSLSVSNPYENEVVNTQSILVSGNTNPGNKVSINGVVLPFLGDKGDYSLSVTLHTGLNTIDVTAVNALNRTTVIRRHIIYNNKYAASVTSTGTPSVIASSLSGRLVINNDSTFVKVVADGSIIINDVLAAGTIKTFNATNSLIIETGRASDTTLSVNGESIPVIGNGVITKTITIDSGGNISAN